MTKYRQNTVHRVPRWLLTIRTSRMYVHWKDAVLEPRVKGVSIPESAGTLPITIPYRFLPASSRSFKCFSDTWKAIAPASPRVDDRYLEPEIESRQSHRRPARERRGCSWKSSSEHPVGERNENCFPAYLANEYVTPRRSVVWRNEEIQWGWELDFSKALCTTARVEFSFKRKSLDKKGSYVTN